MAPLQREDRVAEDDRVEIEGNYGCQSSALDLYLHVPLARGSFPCTRWSSWSNSRGAQGCYAPEDVIRHAARYTRQTARLNRAEPRKPRL